MADISARAEHCPEIVLADFLSTVNQGNGTLCEIAFAKAGTSQFNRAIYYEHLSLLDVKRLSELKINISFSCGLNKAAMQPLILGSETGRKGADRYVSEKNIISFDLDFKDNVAEYCVEEREQLLLHISEQIKVRLSSAKVYPWMTVFSGNGLHLHFKLHKPYGINSLQAYKQIYDSIRCYLECLTDLKFDPACSNPSRLMRLPFSTNWKNVNEPVQCKILEHLPDADFSSIFAGFASMASFDSTVERKFVKNKQEILAKLTLEKVLDHFKYTKKDSIHAKGNQLVCSSPFKEDSNPSFYYDQQRSLFYDFSSGFGGDIFSLVGRFANLDTKSEFGKVLHLSAQIAGIQIAENTKTGFKVDENGIWYQCGNDAESLWLSSAIFVEALTRDSSSQSWGRLLTLKDQDKVTKQWSMPMELLAGDGSEIRRNLLNLGAEMAVGKRERQLFLSFLQGSRPAKRAQCVNRMGWHGDKYILSEKIYEQSDDSSIILQTRSPDPSFCSSGTLAEWQDKIGALCSGNSRLIFAVATAFASVLLKNTSDENGGFHFVGASSIGKSITLKVAASVWGNPGLNGFIKRWRSTLNGLEMLAASRCDSLLILDELGEIQPKDAGNAAYMLSGGTSKNRATKDTTLAHQLEWRLLFLSSGEISLSAQIAQSGQQVNVGQEIRMLDIPAERVGSQGVFENIHGFDSPGFFATTLGDSSEKFFGTPIHDFLEKIVKAPSILGLISTKRREFVDTVSIKEKHGQVHRALKRFSLVAAAGELASELGTLPWEKGESFNAAQKCFEDWFQLWGAVGSRESQQLLQQIQTLLQEFGPSRFPILHEFKKDSEDHHQQLWGFRKATTNKSYEWIVLSEVFRSQLCKGHDLRRAVRDLKEQDLLAASSTPMRLPYLGLTRVFRLKPEIISTL